MWKRIIASIMLVLALMSLGTLGYATNVVDATKYEILNPEKLSFSTGEKVVLINGKAPSGTEIVIDVYGTTVVRTDISKKSFNLDNLPGEKDYILIASEKITSGNMGLFQKQMDLVKGVNKLVINYGVEGIEPVEIIVNVYNRVSTRESIKTTISPLLR